MARRRERIMGFDRLTGIEIADLADRLMEVWPSEGSEDGDIAQARDHIEALDRNAQQLERTVVDLRAELARLEREGEGGAAQ